VNSFARFSDGFLASCAPSCYVSQQEQSSSTVHQSFAPDSDIPPHIIDSTPINSCLCRGQGPKDFTASASEGEESFDRDGSSR
jgi:hypothetical protein